MPARSNGALPPVISGAFGGALFGWLTGTVVLNPLEYQWLFRGDWQYHFLGWHLFRSGTWHLPPGFIAGFLEPVGTTLAYTDSIPLLAIPLKLVAPLLPNPLQYIGLWLLACFVLQGVLGAILTGLWTPHPVLRALGGSLFALVPTLLGRLAHPALCAHWLILWALWLAIHTPSLQGRRAMAHHAGIGLIAALVHPYLAVMVLLLVFAAAARRVALEGSLALAETTSHVSAAAGATLVGWWAAGALTVTATEDLIANGLGAFSMNLLGLINPGGRSGLLADMPWASVEQQWEGFHYLGAGLLVTCVVAIVFVCRHVRRIDWSYLPLWMTLVGCAIYAISPRVTMGDRVIVDYVPYVGEWSVFRATARFFWPVTYALVAFCIGQVAGGARPAIASTLLAGALVLQVADLQGWYTQLHASFRTSAFRDAGRVAPSPAWNELLPHFKRLRLYMPHMCDGPAPMPMMEAAFLAGLHGLSVNDGFAARLNSARIDSACQDLRHAFMAGSLADDTVYLIAPPLLEEFRQRAPAVRCRVIDQVPVCLTARSSGQLALEW